MKSNAIILLVALLASSGVSAEGQPGPSFNESQSGEDFQALAAERPAERQGAALGPEAVDEEGRRGRIHTVVTGTLFGTFLRCIWAHRGSGPQCGMRTKKFRTLTGSRPAIGSGLVPESCAK